MRLNEISEPVPGYTDRERQIKALQILGRKHPERAIPKIREWMTDLSAFELAKLVNLDTVESEKDGSIVYYESRGGGQQDVYVISPKDVNKFVDDYVSKVNSLPAAEFTTSYDELIDIMLSLILDSRDKFSYQHIPDDGYEGA